MKRKLQTWRQLEQCTRAHYKAIDQTANLEKRTLTESEVWNHNAAWLNAARYQRYQAIGLPNPNGMPL